VDIPFVFLSARYSQEEVQRGLRAGAKAFLKKPFTARELLRTI
jgi:DNA-binding response OmpR family regulator